MGAGLVGYYFHSFPKGFLKLQGVVQAKLTPEFYLVQLFEWGFGEESDQIVVSLSRMEHENWRFYDSSEEMKREADVIRKKETREVRNLIPRN